MCIKREKIVEGKQGSKERQRMKRLGGRKRKLTLWAEAQRKMIRTPRTTQTIQLCRQCTITGEENDGRIATSVSCLTLGYVQDSLRLVNVYRRMRTGTLLAYDTEIILRRALQRRLVQLILQKSVFELEVRLYPLAPSRIVVEVQVRSFFKFLRRHLGLRVTLEPCHILLMVTPRILFQSLRRQSLLERVLLEVEGEKHCIQRKLLKQGSILRIVGTNGSGWEQRVAGRIRVSRNVLKFFRHQ